MTAQDNHVRESMAELGAALLIETLARLEAGVLTAQPQDDSAATWAPVLVREHGLIDWTQPAAVIANRARGFQPWPGAWTWFRGKRLNLWHVRPAGVESPAAPGRLFSSGRRLFASCGAGQTIEILDLQQEGRKRLPVAAFLNGTPLQPDDTLGAAPE